MCRPSPLPSFEGGKIERVKRQAKRALDENALLFSLSLFCPLHPIFFFLFRIKNRLEKELEQAGSYTDRTMEKDNGMRKNAKAKEMKLN